MPLHFLHPGVQSPIQMYYLEIFRKLKLLTAVSRSEVHLEVTTTDQYISLTQTHKQMYESTIYLSKKQNKHPR